MTHVIRPTTSNDHDAIRRLVAAELDDLGVAGHVMISRAVLRSVGGTERSIVMLSPLAVAPVAQRRGVGRG